LTVCALRQRHSPRIDAPTRSCHRVDAAAGVVIDSAAPGRTVCEPLLSCASWEAKAAAAEAMG
jgi:hypothetical protein